jgi:hypothetical protein
VLAAKKNYELLPNFSHWFTHLHLPVAKQRIESFSASASQVATKLPLRYQPEMLMASSQFLETMHSKGLHIGLQLQYEQQHIVSQKNFNAQVTTDSQKYETTVVFIQESIEASSLEN